MLKGIYHSVAGMQTRSDQQHIASNNLANLNTTGYKRDRRFFRRLLDNSLVQSGLQGPARLNEERDEGRFIDFRQGALNKTHNPLDIAIKGDGFFAIKTGDSVSYTRNGAFYLNANGELVNNRDLLVLGEGDDPIQISGKDVVIRANGDVVVDGLVTSKIKIVDFNDKSILQRNGFGYFAAENASIPKPPEIINLMQGYLENSNSEAVSEMIEMIELNRFFESCQKSILAQDETLKLAVSEIAG